MGYWYLTIAIGAEVLATLALKASDGFFSCDIKRYLCSGLCRSLLFSVFGS